MPEETRDLFEIMATTRSMRRLKPDPVPDELIRKILEAGVAGFLGHAILLGKRHFPYSRDAPAGSGELRPSATAQLSLVS